MIITELAEIVIDDLAGRHSPALRGQCTEDVIKRCSKETLQVLYSIALKKANEARKTDGVTLYQLADVFADAIGKR